MKEGKKIGKQYETTVVLCIRWLWFLSSLLLLCYRYMLNPNRIFTFIFVLFSLCCVAEIKGYYNILSWLRLAVGPLAVPFAGLSAPSLPLQRSYSLHCTLSCSPCQLLVRPGGLSRPSCRLMSSLQVMLASYSPTSI